MPDSNSGPDDGGDGPAEDRSERRGALRSDDVLEASARFAGHGLTFALSTLVFLLAGRWADERLGTDPVLTMVGGLIGAAAGFWHLYVNIVLSTDRENEDRQP